MENCVTVCLCEGECVGVCVRVGGRANVGVGGKVLERRDKNGAATFVQTN